MFDKKLVSIPSKVGVTGTLTMIYEPILIASQSPLKSGLPVQNRK